MHGVVFQSAPILKLCAARVGNLINYAELGRDCEISAVTAKAWVSVLETSFIVKLLSPSWSMVVMKPLR